MVYVLGGSRGCWTCRKRKIKCDLQRPDCGRCVRSGKECEGYERDGDNFVHFSVEKPAQLSSKTGRRSTVTTKGTQGLLSPPDSPDRDVDQHQLETYETLQEFPEDTRLSQPRQAVLQSYEPEPHRLALGQTGGLSLTRNHASIWSPPISNTDRVALHFISSLEGPLLAKNHLTASKFQLHLPQLAGSSPPLDAALECINAATYEVRRQLADSIFSRRYYLKAISTLRDSLLDERASKSPQVLCATLLLQIYELSTNANSVAWIAHAGGAARLIESRGPDAHRSDIGRAVLFSMRGDIYNQALHKRRHCFLAEPAWDALLDEITPTNDEFEQQLRVMFTFPAILEEASIPGVLLSARTYLETNAATHESMVPSVIQRALRFRDRCKVWRKADFEKRGVQPSSASMPFASAKLQGVNVGSLLSLIIVNGILMYVLPHHRSPKHSPHSDTDVHENGDIELRRADGTLLSVPGYATLTAQCATYASELIQAYAAVADSMHVGAVSFLDLVVNSMCKTADVLPSEVRWLVSDGRAQLYRHMSCRTLPR